MCSYMDPAETHLIEMAPTEMDSIEIESIKTDQVGIGARQ